MNFCNNKNNPTEFISTLKGKIRINNYPYYHTSVKKHHSTDKITKKN